MIELKRKYAKFLVQDCLKLKENDKLFIIGSKFINEFINIVKEEANKLGIIEVETLINDPETQKVLYLNKRYEEIINDPLMDRTKYNQMAREGYAFLNLSSPIPGFYDEVNTTLLNKVLKHQMESISEYRSLQQKGKIKWNISAVPNEIWASSIEEIKNVDNLWDLIFDICLIKDENPGLAWKKKLNKLKSRSNYLNELKIDKLIYSNSLGTNLEVGLPKDYLFHSAEGNNIVNMPTEEVFTSPDRLRINGVVYSSKPLFHSGVLISDFYLKFRNGEIIEYKAKNGEEILKGIIETDEGSKFLGEVALVDNNSPISNTNIVFKNTLFDENASCHLAIGESFPECLKGGLEKSREELLELGLNSSKTHVDFFIGTSDLNVVAVLQNGEYLDIMKKGNFIKEEF